MANRRHEAWQWFKRAGFACFLSSALSAQITAAILPMNERNSVLQEFKNTAANAHEALQSQGRTEASSLLKIAERAKQLDAKWKNSDKQMSAEYADSLKENAKILTTVSRGSQSETKALISAVDRDLQAKLPAGLGIGSSVTDQIEVFVRTRFNGNETNGFLVRCNYPRYTTNTPARYPFPNPTSPSKRMLPAGAYYMWIENSAGAVVKGREVPIGIERSSRETVFFDLP